MTPLTDLLITAAADARAATTRGALPPDPAAPSEVEAVLARLPAVLAAARLDDPEATHATLPIVGGGRWRVLAAAVVRALAAEGVEARTVADGVAVSIPSLLLAAAHAETIRALTVIASEWRLLAGLASAATADAHAGTITLATPHDGRHVVAPGWQRRPPAEVVEEARAALALPSWRIADVAAAWRARAGAEAVCMVRRGIFRGTEFHAADDFAGVGVPTVPALCFALRPDAPPVCYALTPATCSADVAALVERAAQALGLATPGPTAPPARDDRRPLRARTASL